MSISPITCSAVQVLPTAVEAVVGQHVREYKVTSEQIRDQETDELLTPRNAALVVIDFQPVQVSSIASMDRQLLVNNVVGLAKIGRAYGLPIVHSTVNVETGLNKPPIPQLRQVLDGLPTYDRTSINAWEDREFVEAVKATGRRKLIMAALWTEACLTFPTLDALREGYEVYPVVDAVGGTSLTAHEAALRRVEQAGARPITWTQLLCELQRDWSRQETRDQFMKLFIETGGTAGLQFTNDLDQR
ncbi:hydrolase [Streptomyces sp. NPDC052309]|uniref:hydrolase n=1 Tax=Streptomyces sp. NPDC052309 TaxID=3155421 RepID=UPI00341524A0